MPVSFPLAAAVEVGGYISIWKCLVLLVTVLIWARLLTWTDKDAEAAHMPRVQLNLGFLGGLILALLLFFFLPTFVAAYGAFFAIFAVEIIAYLVIRNQKVGLKDLGDQFKAWISSFGMKKGKGGEATKGEVLLTAAKGSGVIEPPTEGEDLAQQKAAYDALQEMFTQPLRLGAERIDLQAEEGRAMVHYWVDGVSYNGASIPKNDAAQAITMLKELMGLDTADRRRPQLGLMKAQLDNAKHDLQVVTAGSTAGESALVDVDIKSRYNHKLDDLGFTPEQLKVIRESIADNRGIVLMAMPKGQGLTTLEYGILRAHDAFLTHIQTIERAPDIELEGITQNELPPNASPSEEAKMAAWVTSQEPEVIMVSRLEDPRSAQDMIKFASAGKRAYIGLRAGSTFEAIAQWRKLVGDDKAAMKHLSLVIAGRVARRLCDACKIDYSPDPDTLRKMNMSPDRVSRLFTARTSPLKDQRGNTIVCEFCHDLRFKGRVGIYELFYVDDEVRQVIAQGGSINQLKMLFKKQKMRYLQENALVKAVAGETSLQEVSRVMKLGAEGGTGGPTTSSSGGAPRGAPSSGGKPRAPSSGGKPPSTSTRRPAPPAPR